MVRNKNFHSLFTVVQGELINKTIIFGPNDTEIPITFEITDDVIPLEPTEEFELSLKGTDTEYNLLFEPNDKTTIYIVDDDGMYFHKEIFMRFKNEVYFSNVDALLAKYKRFSVILRHSNRFPPFHSARD